MISLTVVILTYNEEQHVERAIRSIRSVARSVLVVDSFSSDRTVEIALALGAVVLQNKFINYARQFQWALDNAPIDTDWIMRLDADEIVEPDLATNLINQLPELDKTVVGINLARKHIFLGRWIRHGGRYPLLLLRIWRRGQGRIEDRWMDEHMIVWGGSTVLIPGGFTDHNLNDLTFFTDKHNRYATREAIDVLNQQFKLFEPIFSLSSYSNSGQAATKRSFKERIYNRLSFKLTVPLYFMFRYVVLLGFLDGTEGFIYHFLQGFWYRFLVGAKVVELERAISGLDDTAAIRRKLSEVTNLDIG